MNARWLTRLSTYKNSPLAYASAKRIIELKIERQKLLLARHGVQIELGEVSQGTFTRLLLDEARAAKKYWGEYRKLLPPAYSGFGRSPHAPDIVNRLLDLGYHQLTNKVRAILSTYKIPADLALIHVAHKVDSAPLAYDLVEIFRADTVDAEVLRYVRLKKKPIVELTQKEIARFLYNLNERIERHYYLRDFKICYAYRYYMELQVLKFEKAVNHRQIFQPLHLPDRHESRCLTEKDGIVT